MRSFFLLLLILITGGEDKLQERKCAKGWLDLTCTVTQDNRNSQKIQVTVGTETVIDIGRENEWEIGEGFSAYHNTSSRELRLILKQLRQADVPKFIFSSGKKQITVKVVLKDGKDVCQTPFNQNAYRTAKTTITCEYPEDKYKSEIKFFCKENTIMCEDILSTQPYSLSNGTFTLTESERGFNVSISNVSSEHEGEYWCGWKSSDGRYRAGLKQIHLKVEDIRYFTRSVTVGQNLKYWCKYRKREGLFICKGEDPSICQPLPNGRFSMQDDNKAKNITISVKNVTVEDAGTYWCGATSTDTSRSNTFYHRFIMVVALPSTIPLSTTRSTPDPSESPIKKAGGLWFIIAVSAMLLLLFLLVLIIIFKCFSNRRRMRNEATTGVKENYIYEEIQERSINPYSSPETEMMTVHATDNLPMSPAASLHYSVVNFQQSSKGAGEGSVTFKPGSSACVYSAVKNSQSPANAAVHHLSTPREEPLYSTVNKKQRQ